MFERNKSKQSEPPAATSEPRQAPQPNRAQDPVSTRSTAMIGPSIEIKGTVTGDEDLVIQGKVEGTVELGSHQVTVGQSGKVNADISAKVVNIDGEVSGDLTGGEKVVISKSGHVRGNIVAPRVTLEDGAVFKGSIDMDPGGAESGTVSLAASKPAAKPAEDEISPGLDLKSG